MKSVNIEDVVQLVWERDDVYCVSASDEATILVQRNSHPATQLYHEGEFVVVIEQREDAFFVTGGTATGKREANTTENEIGFGENASDAVELAVEAFDESR